jgi:hypothetical protein
MTDRIVMPTEAGLEALYDGRVEAVDPMNALFMEIALLMPDADLEQLEDCLFEGVQIWGSPEMALAAVRAGGLVCREIEDDDDE